MSWIKNLFQILIVTIILVIGIEVFILYILNYKVVISGNTTCRQYISENDFSVYKPNCELYHKHWEQDIGIEYTINSFGRRDGSQSTGEQLIAFIGDSFTFGAMVNINDNYNYRSLHYPVSYRAPSPVMRVVVVIDAPGEACHCVAQT